MSHLHLQCWIFFFFMFFCTEIPNLKLCCSSSKSRVQVQSVFCRTETRSCRVGAGGPLAGSQNQLLHLSPLRSLSEGQAAQRMKVNVDWSRKQFEIFRKVLDESSPDRPVQPRQRSLLIPPRLPGPDPWPIHVHKCLLSANQADRGAGENLHSSSGEPGLTTGKTVLIELFSTNRVRINQHRNLVVCWFLTFLLPHRQTWGGNLFTSHHTFTASCSSSSSPLPLLLPSVFCRPYFDLSQTFPPSSCLHLKPQWFLQHWAVMNGSSHATCCTKGKKKCRFAWRHMYIKKTKTSECSRWRANGRGWLKKWCYKLFKDVW